VSLSLCLYYNILGVVCQPLILTNPGFFDNPHQEADETSDYYTKHYPQPNGASTSSIQVVVDALSVHVVDDDLIGDVVH
jgi:hypothetical protein